MDISDSYLQKKGCVIQAGCGFEHHIISNLDYDYLSIAYTSFKFFSNGTPAIAYYISNSLGNDSLMYAYFVGSGGNCGEEGYAGKWQCDTIQSGSGMGQYASLDISWDDQAYIAYYFESSGNLKLAYYAGIGNCGPSNQWQCNTLDGTDGTDVGMYASLKAPQSAGGVIRIVYYDKTNGHLKFYNSGFGTPMVVDDMGASLSPRGISMDIDPDGLAVIAYQQIESDFSPPALRISRPYLAYDDGNFGNCGDVPPGYLFQYWRCNTLDNGSQYTDEADYVALSVDSNGLVSIAYTEEDNYSLSTSLKFIYQITQTFLPFLTKP
jgi:hypothetical protein